MMEEMTNTNLKFDWERAIKDYKPMLYDDSPEYFANWLTEEIEKKYTDQL